MRTTSPVQARNGGFIHRIDGQVQHKRPWPLPPEHRIEATINADAILLSWLAHTTTPRLQTCAIELGVSADALRRLGARWAPEYDAWAFPMRDGDGRSIGIRLRGRDGRKWAVRGSRSGLFIPVELPDAGQLLICEGPTDTAALLSIGMAAIGRPSCSGSVEHVIAYLARSAPRDVVIVADRDRPGMEGAARLAMALRGKTRTPIKIVHAPTAKDAREWVRGGATAAAVQAVIQSQRCVAWR
jgi:phage/plasmid primase-like uncharacterized protein